MADYLTNLEKEEVNKVLAGLTEELVSKGKRVQFNEQYNKIELLSPATHPYFESIYFSKKINGYDVLINLKQKKGEKKEATKEQIKQMMDRKRQIVHKLNELQLSVRIGNLPTDEEKRLLLEGGFSETEIVDPF